MSGNCPDRWLRSKVISNEHEIRLLRVQNEELKSKVADLNHALRELQNEHNKLAYRVQSLENWRCMMNPHGESP